LRETQDLLRSEGRYAPDTATLPWRRIGLVAVLGGLLYGAVMGSYGLRPLQALYSSLKVPLLIGGSALLCLPNVYAVNAALGLRDDFPAVLRAMVSAQGTLSLCLAALAPITTFGYLSIARYDHAVLFNGVVFLVAAVGGQVTLTRHYRHLVRLNPKHRVGRRAWLSLYVFVAIQMSWILRPFVGDPSLPPRFLREDAWGNAYVELGRLIWRAVVG
jgi:hypothetical protein